MPGSGGAKRPLLAPSKPFMFYSFPAPSNEASDAGVVAVLLRRQIVTHTCMFLFQGEFLVLVKGRDQQSSPEPGSRPASFPAALCQKNPDMQPLLPPPLLARPLPPELRQGPHAAGSTAHSPSPAPQCPLSVPSQSPRCPLAMFSSRCSQTRRVPDPQLFLIPISLHVCPGEVGQERGEAARRKPIFLGGKNNSRPNGFVAPVAETR